MTEYTTANNRTPQAGLNRNSVYSGTGGAHLSPEAQRLVAPSPHQRITVTSSPPYPFCSHTQLFTPGILWTECQTHTPGCSEKPNSSTALLAKNLIPPGTGFLVLFSSETKSTDVVLALPTSDTAGKLGQSVLTSAFGEGLQTVASSSDIGRAFSICWLAANLTDVPCWEAIGPLKLLPHNGGRCARRNRGPIRTNMSRTKASLGMLKKKNVFWGSDI